MTQSMSLGSIIERNARHRPHHTALVFGEARLSHLAFEQRVNRLANLMLMSGIRKGERVATLLPNCVELLEIYWACARIGVVAVPLSPMLLGPGLTSLLDDSEAVLLFTNDGLRPVVDHARAQLPRLADGRCVLIDGRASGYLDYCLSLDDAGLDRLSAPEISADDVYNIMYTSGTTGMPKGIVLTHRIRAYYALIMANTFRIGSEAVVLQTGSLVFNGAFVTMLPCFYSGATYVLHGQFDADALIETVKREKVTHIMLVPSQIIAMLASPHFNPDEMQSLRMILSLGAPLHNSHKDELQRYLPGRFHELYGLTEGFMTILDRDDVLRKAGSVGNPPPFFDMKIMLENGRQARPHDVGEIVGRGPLLMPGYFKRPDLTAAAIVDGWLHTGDLGYVDEDGFLYLVDRKKDMIDSGGVKVYPRDIEEVIAQHPAVLDAAVFGIPHKKWGETPIAAVVLKQVGLVDAEELKQWVNERVAARYQRLQEVVIMAEFPRNVAGKTLKRELRDPYWEGRDKKI